MQFLRKERKEEFQDEIWIINLDMLADFNSYFSQNNPHLLKERFAPEKRLHQKFEKLYNFEKVHHTLDAPELRTGALKSFTGYLPS